MPISLEAARLVVEIDTGIETINALEGMIKVPSGVSIHDIYTGNSVILIWIAEPTLNDANTIFFAGLSPGGFRGIYPIFSIEGKWGERDLSRFSFSSISALKNDGSGTAVPVKLRVKSSEVAEDEAPPEPFTPIISASVDIFDGKYFISFLTQDKGTGIERYEKAATWFLKPGRSDWIEAKSPLVLSRAEVFQRIHIRAVDKSGNYMEVSTAAPYHYATLLIGLIILLCVLLLLRRSFRSSSQ